MLRFTTNETKHSDRNPKARYIYLLLAVVFIVVFFLLTSSVDTTTVERQKDSLSDALNRDILHCYAVEGYYPPSLDYLKEHYGLTYDEDLFFVDYQPVASNMRPEVTILTKESQ